MFIKKLIVCVVLFLMAASVFSAPSNNISIPNSFDPSTIISSSKTNANNNEIATKFNAHNHTDITALGTVTTGTWNASVLGVLYGGTGSATQNFVDLTTAQTVAGVKTLADVIKLVNGTVSAPSWCFSNDTTTGAFRSAASTIDFACGGSSRLSVSDTRLLAPVGIMIGGDAQNNEIRDNTTDATNTVQLYVGTYSMDTTAPSDEQAKKDIRLVKKSDKVGIDELKTLTVKKFKFNQDIVSDGGIEHTGLIAQEVEVIYPEAVFVRSDGLKAIDYKKLIPLIIKAIQDEDERITALEARITALENK